MSLDVNKMTKDQLRQHILMLAMELTQLEKENKTLKEEYDNFKKKVSDDMKEIAKYQLENIDLFDKLEEENRKLKLHIEAKDKAYTTLLKDYEELKEDRDKMKAEIEEWLNAIRDLHIKH